MLKTDLHRIVNASTLPAAWSADRRFADRWQDCYPKAVACLRADLDDLLTCLRYRTLEDRIHLLKRQAARPQVLRPRKDRLVLERGPLPQGSPTSLSS